MQIIDKYEISEKETNLRWLIRILASAVIPATVQEILSERR